MHPNIDIGIEYFSKKLNFDVFCRDKAFFIFKYNPDIGVFCLSFCVFRVTDGSVDANVIVIQDASFLFINRL